MLVYKFKKLGLPAEYIKYPIYDLAPSGINLNNYLRGGNYFNLSAREAQVFYAFNRTQYEKELQKKLEAGINIVAEDYTGTGLAWGIGAGVDELFLKYINSHLLIEDIAFLFDGERFKEAMEAGHKHETDDELMGKVRWAHLKLAEEKNWIKINANKTVEKIHEQLWFEIEKTIYFQKFHAEALKQVLPENKNNNLKFFTQSGPLPAGQAVASCKNNYKLRVEKLSPSAKIPTRAHATDAGLDLYADDYHTLFPGDIAGIKTGIKMQIPAGCAGLVWDKSGLAKTGLHAIAGVIDSDYRGEIIVLMKNLSEDIINVSRGQKIAQMLIQKIETPEIIEDRVEDKTERGAGGFGSTGLF